MGNTEMVLYAGLAVFVFVMIYFVFGRGGSPDALEKKMMGDFDWQKEKTQECIDLADKSLKVQEDMAKTLTDIKKILDEQAR